jgi:hypothetical protein
MKAIGLDGRVYTWKLSRKLTDRWRSELHLKVRKLLHSLYPLENILEEVYLPGSDGLTADFFIPTRKMLVEAHGEQHYHFVSFFYNTILDFIEAKKRDQRKRQWAEINKLKLVELCCNDSPKQWRKQLSC